MTRDEIKQILVELILDEDLSWAFDNDVRYGENSYFNMIDSANKVAEKILQILYDVTR